MKTLVRFLGVLLLIVGVGSAFAQYNFPGAMGNPSSITRPGGVFYAPAFFWTGRVISGNSSTGSATITVAGTVGGIGGLQVADGTTIPLQTIFNTLTPVIVDFGQGASETVTPTAVSVGTCPGGNIGIGGVVQCASVTASFANTHGQSAVVADATFGMQTAINYAASLGGGSVNIDPAWAQMGGTNALIAAAVVFPSVIIADMRNSSVEYYNIRQTASTFLAVPATLTATTVGFGLNGANTTGGSYVGANTYHVCVSYVDVAGQEGPCSLDFSGLTAGSGSTNQIGIAAPAASAGAVGYTVYISLTGGTYVLAYQAPLTSTTCKLTAIETITPACAVANTTYNQSGSNAAISALTVSTSPIDMQLGAASTTAGYVGNANGRTTYGYVASSGVGSTGISNVGLTFTAGPATVATTVPQVIGTLNIPTGFANQVGKTFRVCGKLTLTGASATIEQVQIMWDGAGSDTAGVPVTIGNLVSAVGPNTAAAWNGNFCESFTTTASGAGSTAGSLIGGYGTIVEYLASAPSITAAFLGGDSKTATTASLNLAGGGGFSTRLHVVQLHTTGTDVSPQLLNLTLEVL